MQFETILSEIDDRGVAKVTLNRPDSHNALNGTMISELHAVALKLGADEAVRVVVLTGNGKSFCAGGDIGWFRETLSLDRADRIAESRGLAEDVNRLDLAVNEIVAAHLEASPIAVEATKKLISFVDTLGVDAAKDYTAEALSDAWESDDGREGIACFLEKRLPSWRSKS